jgi:8-amino-7-oxononanoate synthase
MTLELAADLAERRSRDLFRTRLSHDGPQGPELVVDGRRALAFCSNDYLGLAAHPRVVAALKRGADAYGVGAGASHLVSGHSRAHDRLEEELADFVGARRALLFSTGYMANLGLVTALTDRGDAVFEDRLNHASLIDAGLLTRAQMRRYPHRDVAALRNMLDAAADARRRLVLTDGVFSMDGDLAPLDGLAGLAAAPATAVIVDDAHGLGVLGARGRGVFEHYSVPVGGGWILMGTLGKALGTFGAFVAGDDDLIASLVQYARTYIYTTALPPALAEATCESLRLVREEAWRRDHLRFLVARFREGAAELGLQLAESETPIQPLIVGRAGPTLAASEALRERGILVTAIRPPTVPEGTARLRITLSAAHREEHVDRLVDALGSIRSLLDAETGR